MGAEEMLLDLDSSSLNRVHDPRVVDCTHYQILPRSRIFGFAIVLYAQKVVLIREDDCKYLFWLFIHCACLSTPYDWPAAVAGSDRALISELDRE